MVILLALLLLVFGLFVLYFISSRRFYRRGVTGLETFKSYRGAVVIRFLEMLFWILGWIAIGIGLMLFCVYVL